jgi:hypothetical protein
MGHSLLEVLSVWWIKVVIDLTVVITCVYIIRNTEKKETSKR